MTEETKNNDLIPASFMSFDEACKAIAVMENMDEVKEWRNRAAAFEKYASAAKNFDLEKQAYEIKERAEYRAGQILTEMSKSGQLDKGGRPEKTGDTVSPVYQRLADLGVSKKESSRWQQKAKIPPEEFEKKLKEALNGIKPDRSVVPEAIRKLREYMTNNPPPPTVKEPDPPILTVVNTSAQIEDCLVKLASCVKLLRKTAKGDLTNIGEVHKKLFLERSRGVIELANEIIQIMSPSKATIKSTLKIVEK